jgi:hypothetical protein
MGKYVVLIKMIKTYSDCSEQPLFGAFKTICLKILIPIDLQDPQPVDDASRSVAGTSTSTTHGGRWQGGIQIQKTLKEHVPK